MIKIRDLFSILFIVTLSSPMFTYGNNNPTDYNVVMVIQDDSNPNVYDIIKIDETNRSNSIKLERCSERCETKLNKLFRFYDTPSKQSVSFQIDLDDGSRNYYFKFKSKQALIACKREPSKLSMFYNDGRNSGELRPRCDNNPYSLLQRDRNGSRSPRPVVELSNLKRNDVNQIKKLAKVKYSQASGENGTKKYYIKTKAWELLKASNNLCKNYEDHLCIAWCYNKKEPFNIVAIDRCDFNSEGKKVISFYPKKAVCDLEETRISSYKAGRDSFSKQLGSFHSKKEVIRKQPLFCPKKFKHQKTDKKTMEIDRGISLTPIYINNDTQRFWRHIETDVYFEIDQRGGIDYENKIIDIFERFENDTMLKLNYVSRSIHRSIADYFSYYQGGIHPDIVYEDYRIKKNNHLVYITNHFKKEKHIKYLLKNPKNKVISDRNTVTFILIDEKKSAQRKEVTQKNNTAVSRHAEEILGFQRIVHSVSISIDLLC